MSRAILLAILLTLTFVNIAAADEISDLPSHVQDTAKEVVAEAQKKWRKDAYLTEIALSIGRDAAGKNVEQHLLFTLYSPSKHIAEIVPRGQQYGDYPIPMAPGSYVDLGPVPDFTIDLPDAVKIARQQGLKGRLDGAYIQVHHPKGQAPILAWVVQTDDALDVKTLGSKVPAIDPFTGAVIPFRKVFEPDIATDAALRAAARRFWAALHGGFHGGRGGGGMPFEFGSARIGPDGQPEAGSYYSSDDHDREVLLENTYWNEGPEAYNNALNGESTWTETCNNSGC